MTNLKNSVSSGDEAEINCDFVEKVIKGRHEKFCSLLGIELIPVLFIFFHTSKEYKLPDKLLGQSSPNPPILEPLGKNVKKLIYSFLSAKDR